MKVDAESGGNGSKDFFCTVILSGVSASRSEALAETKDLLAAGRYYRSLGAFSRCRFSHRRRAWESV